MHLKVALGAPGSLALSTSTGQTSVANTLQQTSDKPPVKNPTVTGVASFL